MPELPEVETVKNVINPLIKNKVIKEVVVLNKNTLITPIEKFSTSLIGETFLDMERKGKFLIFNLTNNKVLLSHLRMEGKYFFFEKDFKPNKHDMVLYKFTDGSVLAYNDVRKFGIIGLYNKERLLLDSPLNKLGKEPFVLTKEELFESFKKDKGPTKEALLDQSRIAGLGNIYVDETLFATHIHPKTKTNLITLEQCEDILIQSRRILNEAIQEGGSTIKSFHPSKGVDGRMQNRLRVYGHEGEECPNCGTKFRKITVGGRGTTFCPNCQKANGYPFVVAVTGPIHSGKSTISSLLEKEGFYKIDCDKIVHDLYESELVLNQLIKMFGKSVVVDGKLNKAELSSIIKNSKENNDKLVKFVHPLVAKEAKKIIETCNKKNIVFEVPLLVGSGCEDLCDYVILVLANEDIRKDRLLKEGKNAEVLLKINSSYRLTMTQKIASLVVVNEADVKSLKEQLKPVLKIINKA